MAAVLGKVMISAYEIMNKATTEEAEELARRGGYKDGRLGCLVYGEFIIEVGRPEKFHMEAYCLHFGDDMCRVGGPRSLVIIG